MFSSYLARWDLTPDGDPILTPGSDLWPVRQHGVPAMLKVMRGEEEKAGSALMCWWDGRGAARVLAVEDGAILLERALGDLSLGDLAREGEDDRATQIICGAVAELHSQRGKPLPALVPLAEWFRDFESAASLHREIPGILSLAAETARDLLAAPQEVVALHGDIHHGNILDFGERGWLAIDPKGLLGERAFDYVNLFSNPDLADLENPVAVSPTRFARRVELVCELAKLERRRLLQWILAGSGLSAAWFLEDGVWPETSLTIAELARAELAR